MRKFLWVLLVLICILTFVGCKEPPTPISYYLNDGGILVVEYEDGTTKDLGTISDTIANGVDTVIVNEDGYYVINGIVTQIKAKLPVSYSIDNDGNLIVTYNDQTTENLGEFGSDAINTIESISISEDGYYILNGIKTDIVAYSFYEVTFDTGTTTQIDAQIIMEGGFVGMPEVSRTGYTFDGWYNQEEKWIFNENVVDKDITLTAKWSANEYTVSFITGTDDVEDPTTIIFDEEYELPVLSAREGYIFEGWVYNGNLVTSDKWTIPSNCTLTAKWSDLIPWDDDGVLKILTIGNSFSVDSMEYVYQIAKANGVADVKLGNLYIGSCTIYKHFTNAKNDTAAYTYYTNSTGIWNTDEGYKLSTAVASDNWDFISFQQSSTYSGKAETYDDLDKLINIVKPLCTNPKVSFVWHMTWAYQGNSTHSGFANYDNNQLTMYNAIISATQSKIVTNDNIDIIVPNGTAIQNARTSRLGDTLTRDGYHLSYNQGRVIASLTMLSSLVEIDLDNVDLTDVSTDDAFIEVAVESAKNAILTPFAVTESAFTDDENGIDLTKYVELQYSVYKTSYWQSVYSLDMFTEETGSATALKYWATNKMNKDDLPIGSLIVVESGWRYRPEGWVGDNRNTVRPDQETINVIEVTEAWWGDFTIRAFNIGKTSNGDISGVSEEEIRQAFKIYIPKK